MIIIAGLSELEKLRSYPAQLIKDVSMTAVIQCRARGCQMDVSDRGGFCCIVEDKDDVHTLLCDWQIDIISDIAELSVRIEGFTKKLFVLDSDCCMTVYYDQDLIN